MLHNLSLMKEIVLIGIWTANMVLDPRTTSEFKKVLAILRKKKPDRTRAL